MPNFRSLIIVLWLLAVPAIHAQTQPKERKMALWGHVFDSFTRAPLAAHITLMRPDSSVVDTTTCRTNGTGTGGDSWWRINIPRREAHYIIRAELPGYEPCYVNFHAHHIGRNAYLDAEWHYMKRRPRSQPRFDGDHQLGEVVVTGTKIRMVQRGDTLVFNAEAFNLPEGSMLDALVRQLPGAKLMDNGDIYINGEKIDYLTLNGSDFFKGKNKVMLDNLPYYTVKNLQVYHKSTERSRFLGYDVEKKDYVMDVSLKREYSRGAMANAEAGGGSSDRFMARLFSLLYSDRTRYSFFANANNVNEDRRPGGDGSWTPANSPKGLKNTREAGFNMQIENKAKSLSNRLDVTAGRTSLSEERRGHSQTYAGDGDIYSQSRFARQGKVTNLNLSNIFTMRSLIHVPFNLQSSVHMDYQRANNHKSSTDSTHRGGRPMLSSAANGRGRGEYFHVDAYADFDKKLPWGDNLEFQASFMYETSRPDQDENESRTRYHALDSTDRRHLLRDLHYRNYNYRGNLDYVFNFPSGWRLRTWINYFQSWTSRHNDHYRLDWLPTAGSNDLQLAVDRDNTRNYTILSRDHPVGFWLGWQTDKDGYESFSMLLNAHNQHDRMHYHGGTLDTVARRHGFWLDPEIRYSYNKGGKRLFVRYTAQYKLPDFTDLMPRRETSSASHTRISNPGLKSQSSHTLAGSFSIKTKKAGWWGIDTGVRLTHNAWGTQTWYDRLTGTYTYRQANVDGHRAVQCRVDNTSTLDRKQRLTLNASLTELYDHSVDFDLGYDLDKTPDLRKVDNYRTIGEARLTYALGSVTAAVLGNATWYRASSRSQNFQAINAWDYTCGATLNCTLPWHLTLGTDIKLFSRRGYQSSEMNTSDLVWNAQLSRTFAKGRLTAKVQAFDLLQQLSSTTYTVTAQGRTEVWEKSLPHYVMGTVAWRWQKSPKKQP